MAWTRSHKKGSGGGPSGFPILIGTNNPTSSQGEDGQEYIKYGNYVYKSFYDGTVIVRENTDDSTDLKLFADGLTRSSTDLILVDDPDLLSYISDIASNTGKGKGAEIFNQAGTTQYAFFLQNISGTVYINITNASVQSRVTGTFYGGMIDLNGPLISTFTNYQRNGYKTIGGTAPKRVNNVLLKKNNAWQDLITSDLDDIILAVGGVDILSGTSDPTASIGINGQTYLKYIDYSELYTFKEYLEVGSTAGPYIDTGIYFATTQEFELKLQMYGTQNNDTIHFGRWVSDKDSMIYFWGDLIKWKIGASNEYSASNDNLPHIYKATQSNLLVDETSTGITPRWSNVPTNEKYYMFKEPNHNGVINSRIYYAKIWENGELIAHFVPAERKSDNVYGMLNIVNGIFLTNLGSGSFSVGNTSTGVSVKSILSAKLKVNGSWQDLTGSDIEDVTQTKDIQIKQISYLKWKITKVKGNPPNGNTLQMKEFYLYLNKTRYTWNSNVSITSNMEGNSGEGVDKLIDGNANTKYCTNQWGSSQTNECNIVISLGETIAVDEGTFYTYITGNDEPSRDPISWVLYGSTDGTTWMEIDSRSDVSITDLRNAETFITGFTMDTLK